MKITGAVLREMRAQRPYAQSRPLDVTTVELDEPGSHEVLIRMTAAGLCHSDLSVVDGNRPRRPRGDGVLASVRAVRQLCDRRKAPVYSGDRVEQRRRSAF